MSEQIPLNHVDVGFVIDTTGSMGSFLQAAKAELLSTLGELSALQGVALRVGLVEYRDHPPQDHTFITKVVDLTDDMKAMQRRINKLQASGGGDEAEAVLRGVHDACAQLTWRDHSVRYVFLVGDAPPHGYRSWRPSGQGRTPNDTWRQGCPSGLDVQQVAALAEAQRITLHAICMQSVWYVQHAFEDVAQATGGTCVMAGAGAAVQAIARVLREEFGYIAFDRQVLDALRMAPDVGLETIARGLDVSPYLVADAIGRLNKRGALDAVWGPPAQPELMD